MSLKRGEGNPLGSSCKFPSRTGSTKDQSEPTPQLPAGVPAMIVGPFPFGPPLENQKAKMETVPVERY